ncbi:L,D-transpeptidase family protein [Litorilituus sediminis]|nr:L,D-transpeptidase family protein [Litorilituus sediminis]
MKKRLLVYPLILINIFLFYQFGRGIWYPIAIKFMGKKTVTEVINTYSEPTLEKLAPLFSKEGITYPPKNLALVAFKDTNILELWASNEDSKYKLITSYPIKAASGDLGPKLREGDRQVPEGIYKIIGFNPNSSYHLSMKLNYPNEFDLKHAETEGRSEPGTNIFIHGRAVSIGCLAMGDPAIEQLFSLVYATGRENTTVLISPTDPSKNKLVVPNNSPRWTGDLYQNIEAHYQKVNSKYNKSRHRTASLPAA